MNYYCITTQLKFETLKGVTLKKTRHHRRQECKEHNNPNSKRLTMVSVQLTWQWHHITTCACACACPSDSDHISTSFTLSKTYLIHTLHIIERKIKK